MGSYCFNCMCPIESGTNTCSYCGKLAQIDAPPHQLKPGALLRDRYLVGRALGQGGFGITYIGRDTLLDIRVAIKEFYPNGFAYRDHDLTHMVTITDSGRSLFQDGKQKFLREAQILARFNEEPGIVSVHDYFEENNTAYIVMEYLDGATLKKHVTVRRKLSGEVLFQMMRPLVQALGKVHEQGIIHRDISPDNIIVMPGDQLKLLDFGAAREVGGDKSLSVMLKPGYAPEEQYRSRGKQGPWTDVYALCATMYYCLTGVRPEESVERAMNPDSGLAAPSSLGADITPEQENVILHGMAVRNSERYQTMQELEEALDSATAANSQAKEGTSPIEQTVTVSAEGEDHTSLIEKLPREAEETVFSQADAVTMTARKTDEKLEFTGTQRVSAAEGTVQIEKPAHKSETPERKSRKTGVVLTTLALCTALGVCGATLLRGAPADSEASPSPTHIAAPSAKPTTPPVHSPAVTPTANPVPEPPTAPMAEPTQVPTPIPGSSSSTAPAAASTPTTEPTTVPTEGSTVEPTPAPPAISTPAPTPVPLPISAPLSTPVPTPLFTEETETEYTSNDLLLGHWGETEAIRNGTTTAYYLYAPVRDCREIGMELTIISYEGYPFGDWALEVMDMDGHWQEAAGFKLNKVQGDGRTVTYNLVFDKPMSFQALTICPAEKGMEQTIQRVLMFFCKQS